MFRGLTMRRFRFAAFIVAGVFLLSVSAAYAQVLCIDGGGSNCATGSGWVAGAQAGYNWQQGSWVYGLETDLSGTGLKSSMSGGLVNPCPNDVANTSAKIDWYGTVRGRAGWTAGNVLFYGTGGFAYGKVDLSSSFSTAGLSLNLDTSSVRAGWVAGAGIEYLLQPNLTLNLGYQYVDLGTASLADPTAGSSSIAQTASARAAFSVITV